jgi:hypothetical protein
MRNSLWSKKALLAATAVTSAGLVGATVVGLSTAAPAGGASRDPTTLSYASTTDPPPQYASVGVESYYFDELGNEVTLANPGPLNSVTVTMVSLACESGSAFGGDCESIPGATFKVPITLTLYGINSAGSANTAGPPIAKETETFDIPYRPSADPVCEYSRAGAW